MRRSQYWRFPIYFLMLLALVSVSCRRNTPPPPPAAAPPPPPPPAPAPTITLSGNPTTIQQGQSTTLTWQTQNAATVRIEPGIGEVPASGNRQVTPTSSVTYTATATGPGGEATDTERITVNAAPPPPPAPAPAAPSLTMEELFRQNVQPILFDYDRADLRADQMSRLQGNVAWLRQNANVQFTIEGHADERGSQEYNLGLGDRRANAVRQYLVSQGIAENRMTVVSYGEERPECSAQTEECYQRNRKAAFTMR